MKKAFLAILLFLLGLPLMAEDIECIVGPSLLPVWESKDCGSRIIGYLQAGRTILCPPNEAGWVHVSADDGSVQGWTFRYGGIVYPWDPDYDTAFYDGEMFSLLSDKDAPGALKEFYRRKASIAPPASGKHYPGFDEEWAKRSDREIMKALGPEAKKALGRRNALRSGAVSDGSQGILPGAGTGRKILGIGLFLVLVILLALCSVRALGIRRRGWTGSARSLLLVTGAVEIAYAIIFHDNLYWFITLLNPWIVRAVVFVVFTALLYGQLSLYRTLNEKRVDDGTISLKERRNYLFWIVAALLIAGGSYDSGHVFLWWVATVGVPVVYVILAAGMLLKDNADSRRHGLLFLVSGLGFSYVSSGIFVAVIGLLLCVFFVDFLLSDHSSGKSSEIEENRCLECFWYKHFDEQRHTGLCYPNEDADPDSEEDIDDVDEDRRRTPVGGDGCRYFRRP